MLLHAFKNNTCVEKEDLQSLVSVSSVESTNEIMGFMIIILGEINTAINENCLPIIFSAHISPTAVVFANKNKGYVKST